MKGLKPRSVDRVKYVFKAALNLAANGDARITHRPWTIALKAIGGEEAGARNVILDDADRGAIRGAAYRNSEEFGLLIDVLDETGCRPSQAARLTGEDVQHGFVDRRTGKRQPRLMMPASRKGTSKKQLTHRPVPDRLKGRVPLTRADGRPWSKVNLAHYFDRVMEGVSFNSPAKITMYAFRHTSIVRQLLANVPVRIVAALPDTSIEMIMRNYSKFIADHADELARATLPEPSEITQLDKWRI
jgi:integrase